MTTLRLADIATFTHGRLIGADGVVSGVSTDTRTLRGGELFVALVGESHDAHAFVAQARERGAAAALVSRRVEVDLPQVLVRDTLLALGDLASAVRAQRRARVVGITGSNGKTTVKTLTAAVLQRHGRTHVTVGNLNNEIGLPLTVLALPEDAEFAVLEMGAGKPGDIAYLAAIGRPEVSLVNNIGPAHLERMGSLDGIAQTKGAIYSALPPDGVAVINADDAYADYFTGLAGARRTLRFGLHSAAAVRAEGLTLDATTSRFDLVTPAGAIGVTLPLAGEHNVLNALAASAIAVALDVPLPTIKAGLEGAEHVKGRLLRHDLSAGWSVIDDSYNANPGSAAAAIATLALENGEAWLVLGDMKELGPEAARLHTDIGALAKARGIARLYSVGPLAQAASAAFGAGAQHFADQAALIDALRAELHAGVCCLVKGSRSSAMERVVAALLGKNDGGDAHAA